MPYILAEFVAIEVYDVVCPQDGQSPSGGSMLVIGPISILFIDGGYIFDFMYLIIDPCLLANGISSSSSSSS